MHTFVAAGLQRGSEYRLRCMMEHELLHAMRHEGARGRHLAESDVGTETAFTTLAMAGGGCGEG